MSRVSHRIFDFVAGGFSKNLGLECVHTTGDTPFRRAYIRSVVDQVEVDDTEIRIKGRRNVLERLVMGGGASPAGLPSFVRKWRARGDSNPVLPGKSRLSGAKLFDYKMAARST